MATSKPKLTVYLDPEVFLRLKLDACRPGNTYSQLVQQALTLWYSEDREHAQNNPLLRRMDRINRADEVHTRKLAVMSDALGLFIQYFLTLIPEIPEERRETASDLGAARFNRFVDDLASIRSDSRRGVLAKAEDILADVSAFFTQKDLERLSQPLPQNHHASPVKRGDTND